jgi:hypothetical protein
MRWWRHVRRVAGPPRGVIADLARGEVGAQLGRQQARRAVVCGDQQHRAAGQAGLVVEQCREQERAQGGGDAHGGPAVSEAVGQRAVALVLVGCLEEWSQ